MHVIIVPLIKLFEVALQLPYYLDNGVIIITLIWCVYISYLLIGLMFEFWGSVSVLGWETTGDTWTQIWNCSGL